MVEPELEQVELDFVAPPFYILKYGATPLVRLQQEPSKKLELEP